MSSRARIGVSSVVSRRACQRVQRWKDCGFLAETGLKCGAADWRSDPEKRSEALATVPERDGHSVRNAYFDAFCKRPINSSNLARCSSGSPLAIAASTQC